MSPAAAAVPNAKALKYAPKPKAAGAKRAFSPEAQRAYLEKRLASQVTDGHLAQGLKTVDQLIALAPSASLTATKISFLLHLDRYDTALALLVSLAPEARRELAFEHAYGLYRLGREAEARKVLDQAAGAGEGAEFLQAQLAYRAHEYEQATELYSALLSQYPADHPAHADILQNHTLASSRAEFARTGYLDALDAAGFDELDADALEDEIPLVPTAAAAAVNAVAGPSRVTAKTVKVAGAGKKRAHALPKGAVDGAPFTEDPDRWLPLKARASNPKSANFNPNYTSGTSMSNIASSGGAPPPAAKKKAGGGKKKGKK